MRFFLQYLQRFWRIAGQQRPVIPYSTVIFRFGIRLAVNQTIDIVAALIGGGVIDGGSGRRYVIIGGGLGLLVVSVARRRLGLVGLLHAQFVQMGGESVQFLKRLLIRFCKLYKRRVQNQNLYIRILIDKNFLGFKKRPI